MTATKSRTTVPLVEVLEMFRRECEPDMPLHEVLTFLHIMNTNGDISQVELQKRLGMSQSAVSRAVNKFEKINQRKTKGFNMVQYYVDPMDSRSKRIKFRPRGKDFAERLVYALEGGQYASLKDWKSVEGGRSARRNAGAS